jgi:hypothetical protein
LLTKRYLQEQINSKRPDKDVRPFDRSILTTATATAAAAEAVAAQVATAAAAAEAAAERTVVAAAEAAANKWNSLNNRHSQQVQQQPR